MDSMVFVKEIVDSRPLGLYYLIYWKKKTYAEDIWEPIGGIACLRQLLKKYHIENLDKPTAISLLIDKDALSPPIAACSEAKITPSNISIGNHSLVGMQAYSDGIIIIGEHGQSMHEVILIYL